MLNPSINTPPAEPHASYVAELRRELRLAQEVRNAADARAKQTKEAANKADHLLRDASKAVEQLKADLDKAQRDATVRTGRAIAEAVRAGLPIPMIPEPETNPAALAASLACYRSYEAAAAELAADHAKAQEAANAAAATVRDLVSRIQDADGRALAAQWVAAATLCWELEDCLTGLALLDEKRPGGPRLHKMQEDLLQQVDRRKHELAKNPHLIEAHRWQEHLDDNRARAERAWTDYGIRLTNDADATLDGGSATQ